MAKQTKRQKNLAPVDREKFYGVDEAISLVKSNATAKFDETVEVALNLGVDPRHADQMVRGVVNLPKGTGKTVRVAVFAKGAKADEAKAAGADVVGLDWTVNLGAARARIGDRVALQGNLDPNALFAPEAALRAEVARTLDSFGPPKGPDGRWAGVRTSVVET